jgi:hypothetical protein
MPLLQSLPYIMFNLGFTAAITSTMVMEVLYIRTYYSKPMVYCKSFIFNKLTVGLWHGLLPGGCMYYDGAFTQWHVWCMSLR